MVISLSRKKKTFYTFCCVLVVVGFVIGVFDAIQFAIVWVLSLKLFFLNKFTQYQQNIQEVFCCLINVWRPAFVWFVLV